MRKALTNVVSINPSKLVRRVLSKTSNVSKTSNASANKTGKILNKTSIMNLESELNILKEQICKLQITVDSMQNDSEKKEEAIANLARDKEKLTIDLRKEKRSNINLKQQLEDEREFYFREKEVFCKEINECKKIKHNLKNIDKNDNNKNVENIQTEKDITKLKEALHQTLEANYNLSVKFLRMKNTKYCLKNRLKKLQTDYEKLRLDNEEIIDKFKKEIKDLCDQRFNEPIPPSNKKHIQVIKENGSLLHENLLLRVEVDKLNNELEKYKMLDVRKETKKKLKYIRSRSMPPSIKSTTTENRSNRNVEKTDNVVENDPTIEAKIINLEENINNMKEPLHGEADRNVITNVIPADDGFDMVQISENGSKTSSESGVGASFNLEPMRIQSSPEITQSLYTFNNN